jgi:hypothetical protein
VWAQTNTSQTGVAVVVLVESGRIEKQVVSSDRFVKTACEQNVKYEIWELTCTPSLVQILRRFLFGMLDNLWLVLFVVMIVLTTERAQR